MCFRVNLKSAGSGALSGFGRVTSSMVKYSVISFGLLVKLVAATFLPFWSLGVVTFCDFGSLASSFTFSVFVVPVLVVLYMIGFSSLVTVYAPLSSVGGVVDVIVPVTTSSSSEGAAGAGASSEVSSLEDSVSTVSSTATGSSTISSPGLSAYTPIVKNNAKNNVNFSLCFINLSP